jgi:hypothetical protein
MIWHNGRYWRYDGWAMRHSESIDGGLVKMQRRGRYPGYVQLTDESNGEVLRLRSDRVMINAEPV